MKLARVVGRVFCARQDPAVEGKRLLLIQPLRWEDEAPLGEPIVAADTCGAGASEKVFWVAAREAAHAFDDVPPVDAAVLGIVDGHHAGEFRARSPSGPAGAPEGGGKR